MCGDRVSVGKGKLVLQHEVRSVIEEWYTRLEEMQLQSKGRDFKLDSILEVGNFYQQRYQTEDYFTKHCETGDIILFEDSHFFAKAQRFFTNSDFGTPSPTQTTWA